MFGPAPETSRRVPHLLVPAIVAAASVDRGAAASRKSGLLQDKFCDERMTRE
jgi:hypothetical protein